MFHRSFVAAVLAGLLLFPSTGFAEKTAPSATAGRVLAHPAKVEHRTPHPKAGRKAKSGVRANRHGLARRKAGARKHRHAIKHSAPERARMKKPMHHHMRIHKRLPSGS